MRLKTLQRPNVQLLLALLGVFMLWGLAIWAVLR